MSRGAGTYPNLFCAHPPFQIDGNLGGTAGIAEMLIQSHDGYLHLLPALPDNWNEGSFKGLRVRGGAVVDAAWEAGQLRTLGLTSESDTELRLKVPAGASTIKVKGRELPIEEGFVWIEIKGGKKLDIEIAYN